jgi:light-regulated signal transduction histidine kinase (bacteriophytochrome)/ActR/RegA family two-component response regulator
MNTFDLSECEREPICHLGLVQPHGCLLALSADLVITHASANIEQYLEMGAASVLGRSLEHVLGARPGRRLAREVFGGLGDGQLHHEPWPGIHGAVVAAAGEIPADDRYSLWVHRRGSKFILEWEQSFGIASEWKGFAEQILPDGLARIRSVSHDHVQAHLAAELTARLTAFDRVMVYRFHPDWSGEVIAEVRQPRAEPFLGLRYPASDIPPQARQLYLETLLRVLVDVNAAPVNIFSIASESLSLDLTLSVLRALSPYHIQYLKNMKVGATATASLICNGRLWGLIACHHDRRKALSVSQRRAISEIAQTLSGSIENSILRLRRFSQQRLEGREKALQESQITPETALGTILFGPERLRNFVKNCGMAVWSANRQLRMGDAPAPEELEMYAARVLAGGEDIVGLTSQAELITHLGFAPRKSMLAGLLAIVVSRQPALVLFVFRPEAVQSVIWGGDVKEPVLRDERTGLLSPRRSFAQYKETVVGQAVAWTEEDLGSARIVLGFLRSQLQSPEQISQSIEVGFEEIRRLATDEQPLHNSLLDAISSGVSVLFRSDSGDAALRYANQSLLDLAEAFSDTRAAGSKAADLLLAMGLPADLLSRCESEAVEVQIPSAGEGLRHFLIEQKLALEICDQLGTVSLSALIFTDTTRTERAREAFLAAQEKAKHLALLKTSFLANMSHEIRTPMNGILGMVQLLQTTNTDPEQTAYLDVIQQAGDTLVKLINDILDLSKIEAGHVELEKLPFDLILLVEGVVEAMRPAALSKSIALSAVFETPGPSWFEGDTHRLRQVLFNLMGNAVKFTAEGQVVVSVRYEDREHQPTLVVISVADTGIGIPEDQLAQVFDKFQQADASTTRVHGGTGLGLSICRELTALMGGTISLSSQVGVGSVFTVSIPLARANDPNPGGLISMATGLMGTTAGIFAGAGAGRRILVAEDDLTNQLVIEGMLQLHGFEVAIAGSGLSALDALQEQGCDLILMDCQMPDMDGYQTTKRIREMEGDRHTPIIALTASVLPEDRQRCLDAGMDDYLSKPIGMRALLEALIKWDCLSVEAANKPL